MAALLLSAAASRVAAAPTSVARTAGYSLPLHVVAPPGARLTVRTRAVRVRCASAGKKAPVSAEEAQKDAALGYKKRAEESAAAGERRRPATAARPSGRLMFVHIFPTRLLFVATIFFLVSARVHLSCKRRESIALT